MRALPPPRSAAPPWQIGEAGAHACGDGLAVFYALWRVGHPQSQLVPALVAVTAGGEVGVVPGGEPGGMLPEAELPQWAVSTAGDGGGCRLLAWSRVKMEPSGNVSETLWSTTVPPVSSGRNASTEVLFATGGGGGGGVAARAPRRAAAAARGAAPQGLGYSHALDAAGGLLYAQDGTGDIAVFDVSSKAFKDPLPAGGAERACLHYDPATKRLGALVRGSAAGSWALASVDAATGAVAQRLALPPLGGLVPYSVRDGGPPTCSFSAATGTLAVQLERVDANATYAYARGVEVAVLPVDTRTPAAAASVAVAYDFGKPAAPNATWRMVDPVLSLVG